MDIDWGAGHAGRGGGGGQVAAKPAMVFEIARGQVSSGRLDQYLSGEVCFVWRVCCFVFLRWCTGFLDARLWREKAELGWGISLVDKWGISLVDKWGEHGEDSGLGWIVDKREGRNRRDDRYGV